MSYIKVKNLKGTAGNNCGCRTWIQHWKNISGNTAHGGCHVKDCDTKTGIEGGHVKKVGGSDMSWYIVPLCDDHNANTEPPQEFEVPKKSLVSANKSDSCD